MGKWVKLLFNNQGRAISSHIQIFYLLPLKVDICNISGMEDNTEKNALSLLVLQVALDMRHLYYLLGTDFIRMLQCTI